MRRYDGPYMDGPWGVGASEVCVGDQDVVTIPINGGNTLSSSVDGLKAVAWWYDARHENNYDIDDIDLKLYTTGGTYLRGSTDSNDEKERLFHDVGGLAVELRLIGYDVTATSVSGCNSGEMKVYYAYFWEDDARNDPDGPSSSEIEPE